jgi:3-hydroxyacyl-[acyl-carrier-protein] dehydratase
VHVPALAEKAAAAARRVDRVTASHVAAILSPLLREGRFVVCTLGGGAFLASEPLLDLSTIDLSQVAVSPEEVGRINPQCGDMRQLDHVIQLDKETGLSLGVKHVTDQEFWVPLHIPGRPLMPGVLMIEAAAQLASIQYHMRTNENRFVGFTRCDETVFRGQVVPGDTLYLISEEVTFKRRRFVTRAQGIVNDKLVFESKITGMVL